MEENKKLSLLDEFNMLSKRFKYLVIALVLLCLCLGIVAGCSYGPSPEFVKSMQKLSDDRLEPIKQLVPVMNHKQLEVLNKKEPGAYSKVSNRALDSLKAQIVDELNGYIFNIKQSNDLFTEGK